MSEAWSIGGDNIENCDCAFLCPCLLGARRQGGSTVRPTETPADASRA
jgi:hypothetical protein